MGNVVAGGGGSGDEEEPGLEQESGRPESGGDAGGQQRDPQPGIPGAPPCPPLLPPSPGVLLEQARLREAAARLKEVAAPESVVSRHQSTLLRWLEERLGRGEEAITRDHFIEMLEGRGCGREECEEAFAQFDAEGDEVVGLEIMLEAIKASGGANLQGELSHVIRQLQACSLTPGFIDIFSKSKDCLSSHSSKTLRFLHRNRIPSSVIPYPILECCSNIFTMRSSVLKDYLERLLKKEKECPMALGGSDDSLKLKTITKCYTNIETSSNVYEVEKMTNGETSSFWQSDGSARSHWIRLRMKPDVVLKHLSIAVCAADQSYMPQQVGVAVGRNPGSLQEVREVHIPSHITGYVTLLENANISQMYVQINIKRCYSDGCDTRIHGLRAIGYQKIMKSVVTISDASAIWYLSLLTSLVTASMETNPVLAQAIQQHTQKALQHMIPLSLTQGTAESPHFLSPNILEEVNSFLMRTASCSPSQEVDLNLLAFALARGNVAKVITSFCSIVENLDLQYKAASLIESMESVRKNMLYKYGRSLQFTLMACNVKGKEDKSGPENLLVEPWTGDGFLTESGKTKASVILSSGSECAFQVTQMTIRVRRGAIGARCGLIFAYNCSEKFHAEDHFKRFEKFDTWKLPEVRQLAKERANKPDIDFGDDEPIACFELEEEWDEVEIKMQRCKIAKFWMVKFLCTRDDTAERMGVQGLSALGYHKPLEQKIDMNVICLHCEEVASDSVCGMTLILKTLLFVQQLAHDMEKDNRTRYRSLLDLSGLNLELLWRFYKKLLEIDREESITARTLLLQSLQCCCASLTTGITAPDYKDQAQAAHELYTHLCYAMDNMEASTPSSKALKEEIRNTLLNGAAIFFPDRLARRERLLSLMKRVSEEKQPESAHITFQALCTYFGEKDPSGLALLPDTDVPSDFDIGQVISVMEKLLEMVVRESQMLVLHNSTGECGTFLHSLFWAVQGSFLSWCFCHLKGEDPVSKLMARELLGKYIDLFLLNTKNILETLLSQCSGNEIIQKLANSVFAMSTRQLVTYMLEFCALDIPHSSFLQNFSSLTKLLHNLCGNPEESANKKEMESWNQIQQPVILQTWHMESPHDYENNCRDTTVFLCPGATYFEVEFDDKCETEKRYDYLEFTDARGGKVRYDHKVGTDKWPKKVTFKAGPQLQFLFFSDGSNSEWGFKFTVTAYGLADITLTWSTDLQLLVARLLGRLASRAMALKSICELGPAAEMPSAKINSVVNSPLWKPVFRHQMHTEDGLMTKGDQGCTQTMNSHADDCRNFLLDFATSDPTEEYCGPNSDLFKGLVQTLKKPPTKNDITVGSVVDQTVNCTFAALVYTTPHLFGKLQRYVLTGGNLALSDEFSQVYALADGIRIWMLEMKQKSLHSGGNDKLADGSEINVDMLAKQCIDKCLLLLRFSPSTSRLPLESWISTEDNGITQLRRNSSIVEADFQASSASPVNASPETAHPIMMAKPQVPELHSQKSQESETQTPVSAQTKTSEKTEESFSPPPTPSRKAPFNRARLRLLSFRSMEEAKMPPSVKEKYPILKNILDFVKDPAISYESVLQVLSLRKAQAESILKVLRLIPECLGSLGQPNFFQPPCVLFLLELLTCQNDFSNHFGHLEGCGSEFQQEVRESYYRLVALLVNAVQDFSSLNDGSLLPALSCVQTTLLHMLDMSWEPQDLVFFHSINLPQLLLSISRDNISSYDTVVSPWDEEKERADYRQNLQWLEECKNGMFESWYEKISEAESDVKRKMHLFIARYCDPLNVEISCDGCDKIAPWHRYRCLQCHDMDLCKTCFLGGVKPSGHENDHEMVIMDYVCDHCKGLITGHRMRCNVCDDLDLCYGCYMAMRYPESHLPSHSMTIFPMVTNRTSDRQRLIQPYIHNYSWLLFTALAMYCSDVANEGEREGDKLNSSIVSSAQTLQANCTDLVASCLLKAQNGKDVKVSSLLSMWATNDLGLENSVSCVTSETEQTTPEENHPSLSENMGEIETDGNLTESYLFSGDLCKEIIVDKVAIPSPDKVFAECSQERLLGLIAAMLPPLKSDAKSSIANLQQVLPLMFQVVIANAGHLSESYHLTLGLLGQLILRLNPAEVDDAVKKVLPSTHIMLDEGGKSTGPDGWITTQLLFTLGAECLDSKVGLDWACTMSDILRELNNSPKWHKVMTDFTDHCMQQLPQQLKNTNIFTLLVLVGYPEVLCMGTRAVYIDNAKEPHDVIILKHYTEKNRTVVIDLKTRKRKTVKEYQLMQNDDSKSDTYTNLKKYLHNLASIACHLLHQNLDNSCAEKVEATWVLSLVLKGLYRTLKNHNFEEIQTAFIQSGLLKLLVKKCSKGTGFSKTWLLRDLEILSIMLYSSKKDRLPVTEIDQASAEGQEEDAKSPTADVVVHKKPNPLEGLDDATITCFQDIHKSHNVPMHILRAIYEIEKKTSESFLEEVQKRFDGNTGMIDEKVKKMAQTWQPLKSVKSEEQLSNVTDTDMIIPPCLSKPVQCEKATEEVNPVSQKLIVTSESDFQLSYAKQRRTKSSALLRKELDARSKIAVRDYLYQVNEATAVVYARHVLAALLAEWPDGVPLNEDILELSGAAHITYILNMLMHLEEKQLWEKILQKVLSGCSSNMLGTVALTACQFMEEPGTAAQVRESKHPYNNNTIFEDKVHIPGAIYLSVKFDTLCNTEEGCDELVISSSSDFKQDVHSFSGPPRKWTDFELPGDTLFFRFTSDMSCTEWGYKFTVAAGHRGRFQTGFEILKQMLSDQRVVPHLPLCSIWEWQADVACRQTGHQRLKAIHLLLKILQLSSVRDCDLKLLRPLWPVFTSLENAASQETASPGVLLPLHRALTELFFIAENHASKCGCLQDFLICLTTDEQISLYMEQAIRNIAALSFAINYPNKSTCAWTD